jgi:hypothetical protein
MRREPLPFIFQSACQPGDFDLSGSTAGKAQNNSKTEEIERK